MSAINFEKPDRIPVWDNYIGKFADNWRKFKGFNADINPADYYGIDIAVLLGDEGFFPSAAVPPFLYGEYLCWRDSWGRDARTPIDNPQFTGYTNNLLEDTSKLDDLVFEPASLESRYVDLPKAISAAKASDKCVFAKIGGLYIRSHQLRDEEKLLMHMALDEPFCDALFDRVMDHLTNVALETLSRTDSWDTGLFIYDDMAYITMPMFSPAMFERHFLPRYSRMISIFKDAGCKHVFLHSDGNIGPLLDLLLEAGFEGFNPLEPRCGLDLFKLREKYGSRMAFFGGVCNTQILPRGNKNEIETHIRPLIELGREGGVILGQASISDDVAPEAYDFYMSLIKKYGTYT